MTPIRSLHLAPHLTLPLDAVSRTFGILAVRGAGKSNTAAVMAEEMFAAGLPFVVIDPVGSWYGLRSSADGTSPGLPIPIFGGKHGDVPLERGAGELIADLIVEKRLTCVLDLSRFDSEADKKAFLLAFARRLYLKNENPLHLFLEEADDYIPQSPMGDEKQLLRAWENIVRRGRARGLGMTLITQRSAAVAKMVLTQVETLFAMRTTGPQDIAAIEAWVKYHQVGKEVLSTLASLEDGQAWVWSPHYLKTMARHQIRRRTTFDSGATPANVRAKDSRPPATLADIDIAGLQERMAATIEKAKADDPRELRKQLAEKERRIRELEGAAPVTQVQEVHIPFIPDLVRGQVRELSETVERFNREMTEALRVHGQDVERELQNLSGLLSTIPRTDAQRAVTPAAVRAFGREFESGSRSTSKPTKSSSAVAPSGDSAVRGGKFREMLIALAQAGRPLSDTQMAARAVMALSGTFDKYLSQQRANGWVDGARSALSITDAGIAALGAFDPLPIGVDLQEHWLGELGQGAKSQMLRVLIAAFPKALSDTQVADAAGMALSGTFDKYLSQLRRLQLVDGPRTALRASEELFS